MSMCALHIIHPRAPPRLCRRSTRPSARASCSVEPRSPLSWYANQSMCWPPIDAIDPVCAIPPHSTVVHVPAMQAAETFGFRCSVCRNDSGGGPSGAAPPAGGGAKAAAMARPVVCVWGGFDGIRVLVVVGIGGIGIGGALGKRRRWESRKSSDRIGGGWGDWTDSIDEPRPTESRIRSKLEGSSQCRASGCIPWGIDAGC